MTEPGFVLYRSDRAQVMNGSGPSSTCRAEHEATRTVTLQEIEALLLQAINDLGAHGLPERDVQIATELTQVGEPGVAFEHVCTQLYEYDLAVTDLQRSALARLGTAMKMKARQWEILRRTCETKIACPRCGQDWLRHVRLVHLSLDAVFCPERDALWRAATDVAPTTFVDYGTFMMEHGRSKPDRPSEIELGEPLLKSD